MKPATTLRRRWQTGAASVEYALLAALVAVTIIGSLVLFAGGTTGLFQRTCESLPHASSSCT
jgi:Flp pilus assembly pilin Flp